MVIASIGYILAIPVGYALDRWIIIEISGRMDLERPRSETCSCRSLCFQSGVNQANVMVTGCRFLLIFRVAACGLTKLTPR